MAPLAPPSRRDKRQPNHYLRDRAFKASRTARSGGIQVIARAAEILRVLERQPDGLSLGQIAKAVDLARSTVQRIVAALAREDFVSSAGPNGGVRIGAGLVRLAASVGSDTAELLRPHLRSLSEEVGETVDLAVLSGGSALFIDQMPGRKRLVALSAIGERFPLHCTANGKAILACFAEPDAADLIERSLAEHPEFPLRDRAALMREVAGARKSHLALDREEHGKGISAIGTALLDLFGRPIAISIPAPTARFLESRAEIAERLLAFRERIKPILTR
jgi:DNA-binding IclR family transcriptional regulator